MVKVKILDSGKKVEGGNVIVTKTTEETLDRNELLRALQNVERQKEQISHQNKQLIAKYNELIISENEVRDLISLLPKDAIESL